MRREGAGADYWIVASRQSDISSRPALRRQPARRFGLSLIMAGLVLLQPPLIWADPVVELGPENDHHGERS